MKKVRQLFERVGARRDDRSGKAGVVGEDFVDALRQLDPLIQCHRSAGDVGELLRLGPGMALEPGNQLEHLFGAHARAAARGYRAAGGDEANAWKVAVGPAIDAADGPQYKGTDNERKDVWFRAVNYTVFAWCWWARFSQSLKLLAA